MARIQAKQIGPDEYNLTIVDLYTGWQGSDRTCYWYWNYSEDCQYYPIPGVQYERSYTTTIIGSPSSGGTLNIWDMGYNQTYWFTVEIWGIPPTHTTSQLLATLSIKIQTDSGGDPWSFECRGYDYNGELFLFGKIDYQNRVSHVDITVKNSLNNQYKYRCYLDTVYLPNVFNMKTSRDYKTYNAMPTLPYDTYTFHIKLYKADGTVIGESDLYVLDNNEITGQLWEYEMHNDLVMPSLYYNANAKTITVTNQGVGRYFLEIRRQNRSKVNTSYTEEQKDYFYTTLVRNLEHGKYYEGDNIHLTNGVCQHSTNTIKTVILFDQQAGFTDVQKSKYYNLVCDSLDYIAGTIGITFNDRSQITRSADTNFMQCVINDNRTYYPQGYQMIIRLGMSNTMGLSIGNIGQWNFCHSGNTITTSHACIAVDQSEEEGRLDAVIFEEIVQSLGMGCDSYTHERSLHWDPWYADTTKFADVDKAASKLYHQKNIRGWTGFDLINNYDTPCLLFQDYTGEDLVFNVSDLEDGEDFYAYAWKVEAVYGKYDHSFDNDRYSPRSQISFNTSSSSSRPTQFKWTYPKRKGQPFNITADEWNGFMEHVNEVLLYKGEYDYNYIPVRSGTVFLRWDYNDTLSAIQRTGYGLSIPEVGYGTPITADTTSSDPTKNNINAIVSAINSVPAND